VLDLRPDIAATGSDTLNLLVGLSKLKSTRQPLGVDIFFLRRLTTSQRLREHPIEPSHTGAQASPSLYGPGTPFFSQASAWPVKVARAPMKMTEKRMLIRDGKSYLEL